MLNLPHELSAFYRHSLLLTEFVLFQAMAVDIHSWAQSLVPWPPRTIQAPTPATAIVSGGFVCQKDEHCDYCLQILMLRAVQIAGMAL